MKGIEKRLYGHMHSLVRPVKQVCPKTGDYIEDQELPMELVVHHWLINAVRPQHPLDKYKAMGVKNMTEEQIASAYKIIKGYKNAKQFN